MLKTIYPRLLLAFAVLCLVGAGLHLGRSALAQRRWAALRPELPAALGDRAPGLDARLQTAAARFADWPPDRAALADFTRATHANGQLDTASAGYRALIQLEPAEPRWPHRLALIVAGAGRLDEALPLLRRTTELAPDYVPGWLKLGDALLKTNDLAAAQRAYEQAQQRDPGNRFALLGLARCDLQAERLTAARAKLQRAVADQPDFASAQSLLGSVHERLGNASAAAAARARVEQGGNYAEPPDPWAEELVDACHDPYALLVAASAAAADRKPDKARALLARAFTLAPADPRLHRQLARLESAAGNSSAALAAIARAVALEPSNDAFQLDQLSMLRQARDPAGFTAALTAALQHCPDSPGVRFEAGAQAAQAGDLDTASQHFEFSWKHGPDQPVAAVELARLHFRAGRPADAVRMLEEALARFPKDQAALLLLARHGQQTGDPRAAEWLRRAGAAGLSTAALGALNP